MFDPFSFLINLVVGAILSIASTLLQQAFAKPQEKRTGTRGSRQMGGTVPQSFLVGTIGVPGKFEYAGEYGSSGGVPNVYATDVYSFGDLPITGFTGLFVNGVAATLGTAGAVEQGFPIPEYNISGGNKLWWRGYTGGQTVADSFLVSKFGAHPERPWSSAMIGRGVPYVSFTSFWHEEVWTKPFQDFMVVCQGIRLYDPRRDSTAGGSGSQRWDNPATWAFSDNSIVIIYNILRGIHYDGNRVWGGTRTAAQLPYAPWAAAMDACDQLVPLKEGGTEKRFRAGREIFFNERPADVITELLVGANSRISYCADGTVYVLVGVPEAIDGSFSDTDVLASEPLGSIPFPNFDEIINGATASYIEPTQAWEPKDTAPYYRSDLEIEDGGERKPKGFELPTTFSGTQAQRVLQAVVEEGRRFRKHVVALPAAYAKFRPLQVLAFTSGRFGYSAKRFLITARTATPWGVVIFGLQEVDPGDHAWNPATDERPIEFAPIKTNRPAPQIVSGVWVEPIVGTDSDGKERRGGYAVHWPPTAVAVDVEQIVITHRLRGEVAIRWTGPVNKPEINLGGAAVYEALIGGETFEVKLAYIAASGRRVEPSNWLEVAIPNIKLTSEDLIVDLAALDNRLSSVVGTIIGDREGGIPSLFDAVEDRVEKLAGAVARLTASAQAVEREQRISLLAERDRIRSSYELTFTAIADLDIAMTQRLEALRSDFETEKGVTSAAISDLAQTMVTADEAISQTVQSLRSDFEAEKTVTSAAISNLQQTVASETEALALSISGLTVRIEGVEGEVDDVEAAVLAEQSARIAGDEAISLWLTEVATRADDATAGGLIKWEASAGPGFGQVDLTMLARVTTAGALKEMGIVGRVSSTAPSEMLFLADRFYFWDGNTQSQPVTISGGKLIFKEGRFEYLASIDGETIVLDGITGNFSFG